MTASKRDNRPKADEFQVVLLMVFQLMNFGVSESLTNNHLMKEK